MVVLPPRMHPHPDTQSPECHRGGAARISAARRSGSLASRGGHLHDKRVLQQGVWPGDGHKRLCKGGCRGVQGGVICG
jgi:hypothetical protein